MPLPIGLNNVITLTPIERPCLYQYADSAGKVPGLGIAVGALRIISSIVLGAFASLGVAFCEAAQALTDKYGDKQDRTWKIRSEGCQIALHKYVEFGRGFLELIPIINLTYYSDKVKSQEETPIGNLTYYSDKVKSQEETECSGNNLIKLSDGAYGRYLYIHSPSGFCVYSQNCYRGNSTWYDRMVGSEVHGAICYLDRNS